MLESLNVFSFDAFFHLLYCRYCHSLHRFLPTNKWCLSHRFPWIERWKFSAFSFLIKDLLLVSPVTVLKHNPSFHEPWSFWEHFITSTCYILEWGWQGRHSPYFASGKINSEFKWLAPNHITGKLWDPSSLTPCPGSGQKMNQDINLTYAQCFS